MLTVNALTGFGISYLELLLLLVGLVGLMVISGLVLRRHWHGEVLRRESALLETQHQCDQLRGELAIAGQRSEEALKQSEQLQQELAEAQSLHDGVQGELTTAKHQVEQVEIEMTELKRQREIDKQHHESKLNTIRETHDPVRIKELLEHSERMIAHQFGSPLFDIAERCREAAPNVLDSQHDLRMLLMDVNAEARNLLQRTKVILGSARLESVELRWETLRTRRLLEQVINEELAYAEARRVHILPDYGSLRPILTDRLLLHDLCTVVIHNAIQYAREGNGEVKITQRLEDEKGRRMFIDVKDNGSGIANKDPQRIFAGNGGLGLNYGLRIARRLGGDLTLVESSEQGSLFRIILPYGEGTDQPSPGVVSEGVTS